MQNKSTLLKKEIQTLLTHPIFANVSSSHIDFLLQDITYCEVSKKGHILYCGDVLNHYYYTLSGIIQLYRPTIEGEEKVFYLLKDKQMFFAESAFSPKAIAPFSVVALKPSVILQLSSTRLIEACKTCPQLAINLLKQANAHYQQSINRIDVLTISNASQRFVLYLFDLADTYHSLTFELPLTQKALARQLNITPETLSRIIHKLCTTEFLKYHHSTLILVLASLGLRLSIITYPSLAPKLYMWSALVWATAFGLFLVVYARYMLQANIK